jgi:hypothetical protein
MLQLWLRCCLTSGFLLCGRAGTSWVGGSGIMFRISLGGLLCRLQLVWGEVLKIFFLLRFRFLCPLLAVGCCWLLVDSLDLRLVLISAIFILWWWFSVLKGFLLLFILLNDVRCCAFVGFYLRSSRFFDGCALVSSESYCGWWLWYGWMVSLGINDYFTCCLGL